MPRDTQIEYGANPKWLEVLREIVSRVTQTAVLRDRAIHEGLGQFT